MLFLTIMGQETSKYKYNAYDWDNIHSILKKRRAHTTILVVGDRSSGKTTLSKKITKLANPWIHTFDTDTHDKDSSMRKIREAYVDGIDVSGMSILSSNLPLHGIIWSVDARKMNTDQDFQDVNEICWALRVLSNAKSFIFFTHTDLANKTNLNYIKGLYEESLIPGSGEWSTEWIYYCPLLDEKNKDTDFTTLTLIKVERHQISTIPRQ